MAMTASSRAPQGGENEEGERSPFLRVAELLAPYQPGKPLITLSLGEPQHPVPRFVAPVLAEHIADFGRYPIAKGIEPFRRAAAGWLSRRFDLPRPIDPDSELLVLSGSREGLFFAALTATRFVRERKGRPAILMPNPFYPAYGAGARAAGCEPIYLPTTVANGFLPDLDTLDEATLARTVAMYIASPANPQGSVASRDYFSRLKRLADRHSFILGNLHANRARQHARMRQRRFCQRGGVSVALEAFELARYARRFLRGRQAVSERLPRTA
jgi:N-succinyldiaminopimelate aminotransferase